MTDINKAYADIMREWERQDAASCPKHFLIERGTDIVRLNVLARLLDTVMWEHMRIEFEATRLTFGQKYREIRVYHHEDYIYLVGVEIIGKKATLRGEAAPGNC